MRAPYIIGGAFISYSEVFGVRPTLLEFRKILRELDRNDAIFTLVRVNTLLRHSILEPGRPNFAKVQQFLGSVLFDQTTIDTLKQKVGENTRLEERPLFHPLQVLAVQRTVLLESKGEATASTEENAASRNKLGLAA
jgi:hypothetical protein